MRIESYNQVHQAYQLKKSNKAGATHDTQSKDQVAISDMGKTIQQAKQAVAEAPDIREDIVGPIKEQIQNGTYQVSASSFADKMLAKYEEQMELFL